MDDKRKQYLLAKYALQDIVNTPEEILIDILDGIAYDNIYSGNIYENPQRMELFKKLQWLAMQTLISQAPR